MFRLFCGYSCYLDKDVGGYSVEAILYNGSFCQVLEFHPLSILQENHSSDWCDGMYEGSRMSYGFGCVLIWPVARDTIVLLRKCLSSCKAKFSELDATIALNISPINVARSHWSGWLKASYYFRDHPLLVLNLGAELGRAEGGWQYWI